MKKLAARQIRFATYHDGKRVLVQLARVKRQGQWTLIGRLLEYYSGGARSCGINGFSDWSDPIKDRSHNG
jgi:hypothetical protein